MLRERVFLAEDYISKAEASFNPSGDKKAREVLRQRPGRMDVLGRAIAFAAETRAEDEVIKGLEKQLAELRTI
ncbi:hypothetical protein HZB97_02920 [Candidatus Gottesmanbacteria bacterium]|nr:hypothetical protein [Candidatus Gottesmanbacteria bacterium]